jgi:hypothetical protein
MINVLMDTMNIIVTVFPVLKIAKDVTMIKNAWNAKLIIISSINNVIVNVLEDISWKMVYAKYALIIV